ncbi:MAG: hypothetical protein IKC43_06915 [Clostridia bacterium]|nr:hypothetical protein [Clostridia bacterium]
MKWDKLFTEDDCAPFHADFNRRTYRRQKDHLCPIVDGTAHAAATARRRKAHTEGA